jgi:homopolymeric O-antigen transport system ATP-binding protein
MSMPDTVISVENLSKSYLIGHQSDQREHYKALRDVISREARSFARRAVDLVCGRQIIQGDDVEELWALKDVSFELRQGDILGIVGSNGAGKSTLLKILGRITEPSRGRVRIKGRVASLLEVGTGFHPELSGRENIFLNGAILGMTRAEIRKKFDEIVAFADVEKFLDTPIKRYSSGMYLRLAFAVAAHLDPDILVVDEVLAVGDAEFQKKCLGKLEEVSRREGRTVLLVSHNMGAITTLCPKAIWLQKGSICDRGESRRVVSEYLAQKTRNREQVMGLESFVRLQNMGDRLRLKSIEWLCELPLRHGEPVKARIHFNTQVPVKDVIVGIGFSGIEGRRVITYNSDFPGGCRPSFIEPGTHSVDFQLDALPLAPDIYGLELGARSGDFGDLDYIRVPVWFDVVPGDRTPGYLVQGACGVYLAGKWEWKREEISRAPIEALKVLDQGR